MAQNSAVSITKYIFGEVIGDFIYAPVWWYTRGFLKFLGILRDHLHDFERSLGLKLWVRSLGKPMYGQYDIAGKIISFLMRMVVLFGRFIAFVVYFIFIVIIALAWLAVPLIVVWQIFRNLTGLFSTMS